MIHHLSLLSVLICAVCVAADDWRPPNLAQNPGFEELADNGAPAHWGADSKVYTSVTSPTHSGDRALQFVNDDPDKYVLCGQNIALAPGKAYEVSVRIKTEDVKGEDSGATICLEWWGEGGEYLGGHYPRGFKGDTDWRHLKSAGGRVREDAVRCNVTCYLRKGMSGKAWWDDVEVRQWQEPPMSTLLLAPNYRGLLPLGEKLIEAQADVSLRDYGLEFADVAVKTQITREADGRIMNARRWTPDGPEVRLSIPTTGLQVGKYELKITLERTDDSLEMAAESWRFTVVEPGDLTERTSYIDVHNRLIRNGEPFFPLGMYWSGINEADLKLYADSAFNCLMPYGAPNKEKMDLAHSLGLKVIYSVKDIYYGSRYCPKGIETIEDERAFIEKKATEYRDHPALLAWYLNDELSLRFMDRLEAHQQWLEELDPDHPTWVVLYQVGQVQSYVRSFDAIGTDPYPIPASPARRAADWTKRTVQGVRGHRPVWQVPQVFNWACYRKTAEEKKDLRPPTLAEMRSMAWQCITEGANGLIFYSWFDIKRDKTVPFEEQWGYVKQMASEIEDMIPVILSVEEAPQFRAAEQEWLHWTTRKVGDDVYLIAVNDEGELHKVTFDLRATPNLLELQGKAGAIKPRASLDCEFEPFEVKVYRVRF